jgi:hypothetical protein
MITLVDSVITLSRKSVITKRRQPRDRSDRSGNPLWRSDNPELWSQNSYGLAAIDVER